MAVLDSEREEATGHVRILMVAYKPPEWTRSFSVY